ncbi:tRNA (adenosine(37)-N6)-threonylcarbamoyltransferase complex ATPase subunit type 1 TsaE [Hymenobacter sp. BT188]|uniref:tRNA (adenosine(37)-N6)-threonylcarbamoyltransferase complex ATPase subunit type 1 TsaE n=1 Tax=Hymenobacter sp. BT188 TaxID=2763504 RepID=UPI001650FC17|nr:tRNA (adenosine(37)-N6)-threonylcarbamoyltransferase complex ATPase subunit type 1 TsaE [Hymenobacter sp. BT188]MBC6607927.1 tRNA (adenosine(37)-N6)-threonylcarbamoyltransferase complex ATPase subunit type 1 TsaE [Hymenobacter sp. BT188]
MAIPETEIAVPSLADLPAAAAQLRASLSDHNIILFEGEMGAGKTTLIKALCENLGVPASEVSSPTFSLVNEYRDARNQPIYHFDFYRLDNSAEALAMGALEYFDSGYLCLIEWPSRVSDLLPPRHLLVTLTVTGEEARVLQLKTMS